MRVLLIFAMVSVSVHAQNEPVFKLEEIRIDQTGRTSPQILIAASLLKAGKAYSEHEIMEGAKRVTRLPFIVHAAHKLESIGEDGGYRLIIEVREQTTVHMGVTADVVTFDSDDYRQFDQFQLGGQWFLGSAGQLRASVIPDLTNNDEPNADTIYQVGYSHYHLFGRGIRAHLDLAYSELDFYDVASALTDQNVPVLGRNANNLTPSLRVEVPVFGNHEIRFGALHSQVDGMFELTSAEPGEVFNLTTNEELSSTQTSLGWFFDSTNDELFPSSGTRWNIGGRFEKNKGFGFGRFGNDQLQVFRSDMDSISLNAAYTRFFSLGHGHTLFVGAAGSWEQFDRDSTEVSIGTGPWLGPWQEAERNSGTISTGYAYDIFRGDRFRRYGDFRFEIEGSLNHEDFETTPDYGSFTNRTFDLATSLSFRTDWGLFKWSLVVSEGL